MKMFIVLGNTEEVAFLCRGYVIFMETFEMPFSRFLFRGYVFVRFTSMFQKEFTLKTSRQ